MGTSGESKVGRRLSERPAPEVTKHIYGIRVREEVGHSFHYMTLVNRAHVVMLNRQRIITDDVACALLSALSQIDEAGPAALDLDPEREDLFYNYEHAVISRTGAETGGQMHTARSRNDLGATMTRMRYRDVLVRVLCGVRSLRTAILDSALEHAEVVMPGYTHLQPAQPITLGHYLTAIESALARDSERFMGALIRTNLCPLGAAALAGTGYPIDRHITAEYLGFDGLVTNTLDCVASRDFLLEALASASIMGATLSRFAHDLYVWYTDEFGMIGFNDRVSGTSSIMPQKKNPVVLESIKGRSALSLGAFTAAISAVRNTQYSNVIDANREGFRLTDSAISELESGLALAQVAITNVIVREDLMKKRASENFSTVTQLADVLVTKMGVSFRQAHEIVGGVVRMALDKGARATGITSEMVREMAREVLGSSLEIEDSVMHEALDPLHNVAVRCHPGGPAPDEVRRMVKEARSRLAAEGIRLDRIASRVKEGRQLLDAHASMIGGTSSK